MRRILRLGAQAVAAAGAGAAAAAMRRRRDRGRYLEPGEEASEPAGTLEPATPPAQLPEPAPPPEDPLAALDAARERLRAEADARSPRPEVGDTED